ncbi:MAG TPA: aminodeoxychorismate/anthranilate synthase component II [Egicoccus sp.]|nr:aminodeoxychorismate/anthranilate synthase component II [Egicoccus sp.]HSK22210.1 aminodeoxychorismate/anthranilate synthase component II [Egicoccus sp.]
MTGTTRPRLLLVDNYDSFTYNLAQELGELGADVEVVRNDAFTLAELEADLPDGIVISPGPGVPSDAGLSNDVIRLAAGRRPVLGVCLGHQCIGEIYGGRIVRAPVLVHGKTSPIYHRREGVLADLPVPFDATRYHSLIVDRESLPPVLKVTAETSDGLIMALRHRELDVEGVQFHPESVLTSAGMQLLGAFVRRCSSNEAAEAVTA